MAKLLTDKESIYTKSNEVKAVRLKSFSGLYTQRFLACGEGGGTRQRAGQALLDYLCDKFKISRIPLTVSERPRRITSHGGQKYGWYRYCPLTGTGIKIYLYNTTAKTLKPVAIKTLYDTLLHEFCHHYDTQVLRFAGSPHTAGFYTRISDLKAKLAK